MSQYCAKKFFVCYLQGQGHNEGSYNQNIKVQHQGHCWGLKRHWMFVTSAFSVPLSSFFNHCTITNSQTKCNQSWHYVYIDNNTVTNSIKHTVGGGGILLHKATHFIVRGFFCWPLVNHYCDLKCCPVFFDVMRDLQGLWLLLFISYLGVSGCFSFYILNSE